MEGVEILNTTVVYVTEYSPLLFWIPVIACALIGFLIGFLDCIDFGDGCVGLIAGLACGILVGALITVANGKPTDEILYVEHQVVVSDDVNMNEFFDHYDYVRQDGKIYTVWEKQDEQKEN